MWLKWVNWGSGKPYPFSSSPLLSLPPRPTYEVTEGSDSRTKPQPLTVLLHFVLKCNGHRQQNWTLQPLRKTHYWNRPICELCSSISVEARSWKATPKKLPGAEWLSETFLFQLTVATTSYRIIQNCKSTIDTYCFCLSSNRWRHSDLPPSPTQLFVHVSEKLQHSEL